jgi:hypothetical protein
LGGRAALAAGLRMVSIATISHAVMSSGQIS